MSQSGCFDNALTITLSTFILPAKGLKTYCGPSLIAAANQIRRIFEPCHDKIVLGISVQVRHNLGCTTTKENLGFRE